MRTGIADLPLHSGPVPPWLFQRMAALSREIVRFVVEEFGREEFLRRLADPFWFQALGCVLGFDWHSSGLTTTVCGALKEGLKGLEGELGLFIAGGKGAASRRTPQGIEAVGSELSVDPKGLIYASRMSAKVDNTALQDGYQLYHHAFLFTKDGRWGVIQQGMNEAIGYARRYHWLGEKVQDFVSEPEAAICCDRREKAVLNLVAKESQTARDTSAALAKEPPEKLVQEVKRIQVLKLPPRHEVLVRDLNPGKLYRIFTKTYEKQPEGFEGLLGIEGVGPKTIRALSLIAELIYGAKPSFQDPARFSFAHGGKDRRPYPVDRKIYDRSIEFLRDALASAKIGYTEKKEAFRRLERL